MSRRYVPKTYNNRRLLRIIIGTLISVALAAVILFVLLFYALQQYWHWDGEEGRLDIPWLAEDTVN